MLLTEAHPSRRNDVNFQLNVRLLRSLAVSTERIRGNVEERLMIHIPTSASKVAKLKKLAKAQCKVLGIPLQQAQDVVAREHGYQHWKHLTVCAAATSAPPTETLKPASPGKPSLMEEFDHLLSDEERLLFENMSYAARNVWLVELAKRTPESAARFKPLQVSVTFRSRDAVKF
jgi:hypothetical protein